MKARLVRTFRSVRDDFKCGRCSGFPPCCVLFYSLLWSLTIKVKRNKILSPPHQTYKKLMEWRKAHSRSNKDLGYIPCPWHLLRWGPVHPGRCAPGCVCGLGNLRARKCANVKAQRDTQETHRGVRMDKKSEALFEVEATTAREAARLEEEGEETPALSEPLPPTKDQRSLAVRSGSWRPGAGTLLFETYVTEFDRLLDTMHGKLSAMQKHSEDMQAIGDQMAALYAKMKEGQ